MSSYCEERGKDRMIFLNASDAQPQASSVTFSPDSEDTAPKGLILADGSINWNCPCLGGMPVGPCGVDFRSAFECFHTSEAEPKGSECLDQFARMQDCMKDHPELYGGDDPPDVSEALSQSEASSTPSQSEPSQAETSPSSPPPDQPA